MSSAGTHDIKVVTNVVDNIVIKQRRPSSYEPKSGRGKLGEHLCLDKAYNSEPEEQELLKRGYVLHMPHKGKKEGKQLMNKEKKWHHTIKNILPRDGLWREQTHGTTGFENCSHDMKRRLRVY